MTAKREGSRTSSPLDRISPLSVPVPPPCRGLPHLTVFALAPGAFQYTPLHLTGQRGGVESSNSKIDSDLYSPMGQNPCIMNPYRRYSISHWVTTASVLNCVQIFTRPVSPAQLPLPLNAMETGVSFSWAALWISVLQYIHNVTKIQGLKS